jgi:group II intron reverse transcriptase/maturase
VLDRFIQQMLLHVLTPIFEPLFSEHSYGFRPERGAHDAVRTAQGYVLEGQDWVVDIDIAKFFDHVNHDLLMGRIGKVIRDKRVLGLIGKYLRRGALLDGLVEASVEGTPQGGPLSPLLANIYLDPLDKELEKRGHKFCRYADDCNIYVGSEAAAERTLASIGDWIEKHLRLKVNRDKSGKGKARERKFLGFRLNRQGQIEAAPEAIQRFKTKVREMWRSCQSKTSKQLRDDWQRYVRGCGATTAWPKNGSPPSVWRVGSGDTSGNASGCAGTARGDGKRPCGGWECIPGCCARCVRVGGRGSWRTPRP